jgi:hypothetical protein
MDPASLDLWVVCAHVDEWWLGSLRWGPETGRASTSIRFREALRAQYALVRIEYLRRSLLPVRKTSQ